jgi:DNA repair exonuclease SbcCD ATPase subunit
MKKEIIQGGRADGKPDSEFDSKQVAKGIAIEKEHTKNESLAKEIAKDHLSEIPDYYDKLEKMEKQSSKLREVANRLKQSKRKYEQATRSLEDLYQETPYANVDKPLADLKDAFASGNQQKIWDSYKMLTNSVHWLGKAMGIK